MVAADRQHAGVLDDAVGIDDVFGRPAADVDDQRAEFLLLVRQQRERRGQAVEHDVVHLQLQPLDGANRVLQPVQVAMHDVHVHLDARAEHAHRVGDAVLPVHQEMLADGVDDMVLGGQVDRLGVLDHVLHVVFRNLAVGGDDRMHAAVVEAAQVAAGDAEIDAADLDIGHLLGLHNGVAHVLLGRRRIGDFAFAHAARARLAQADDVERAIGAEFADHGADLGRADFQSDDDRGGIKHVSSWGVRVWVTSGAAGGTALASSQRSGNIVGDGEIERGDRIARLLAQLENGVPAPQLLLEIGQAESHFAPLPRRHHQHLRGGHVHPLQVHQPGHRRLFEGHEQLQGGLNLRGRRCAGRAAVRWR